MPQSAQQALDPAASRVRNLKSGGSVTLAWPVIGTAAYVLTKTGNVTISLAAPPPGGLRRRILLQVNPGSGGFVESFSNSPVRILWAGTSGAPTPSTSWINFYLFTTNDGVAVLGSGGFVA